MSPEKQSSTSRLTWPRADDREGNTLPAGILMLTGIVLTLLTFIAREPYTLLLLTMANILLILISGAGFALVFMELRVFLMQSIIIIILYQVRFGFGDGIWPGLKTSWQLMLTYFPGVIIMVTVGPAAMIRTLSRFMTYRLAFIISTSLRLIPLLKREAKSIYHVQVFRGARVLPSDLINPKNWGDVIHCLAVPLVIDGLRIAREVSLAATIREFGAMSERTCRDDRS